MSSNVGNVGNAGYVNNTQKYYEQNTDSAKKTGKTDVQDNPILNPLDTYMPSDEFLKTMNAKDPEKIKELWNQSNQAVESLRQMVSKLLGEAKVGGGIGQDGWGTGQVGWAAKANSSNYEIEVDEATQTEAQQMISDEGFYGVKKTTERIMDFAKSLIGEDASEDKIEDMRAAVQKGFDDVAKMFGGFDKLPDVTKDTYESIMKSFDDWKSGKSAENTEDTSNKGTNVDNTLSK